MMKKIFQQLTRGEETLRSELPLSKFVSSFVRNGRILDLGAGRGWNMALFCLRGYEVVGIDKNLPRLKEASKHGTVILCSASNLPFRDRSFDITIADGLLHHVQNPQQVLQEVSRVSKDGGLLYIAEVVEDRALLSLLRIIYPYWDGEAVRSRFTKSTIRGKIYKSGFNILKEDGWGGNVYWLWLVIARRWKFLEIFIPIVIFTENQINKRFQCFSSWYQAIALK